MIQSSAMAVARVRRSLLGQFTGSGLLLFSALLVSLPSAGQLAEMQALNRELGKLCSNPPPRAVTVCRLHARLVNTFNFG